MKNLRIILFLLIVLTAFCACDFLPAPLAEYNFIKDGAPDYFFDDFEEIEGDFSSRYFYERTGFTKPSLYTADSHSTQNSIKFQYGSELSVSLNVAENGVLNFWIKETSSYWSSTTEPENLIFQVDNINTIPELTGRIENEWYKYSVNIAEGEHKVLWKTDFNQFDSDYYLLDDISFAGFMRGALPADNSIYCKETPAFDWNDYEGASAYHFQLADSTDFANPLIDIENLTVSALTPTENLEIKKTYYWRVRPYKSEKWLQWSTHYKFSIAGDFVTESFETTDGNFSTLNFWTSGDDKMPEISDTSYSFDGDKVAKFTDFKNGCRSFSTAVNYPEAKIINFFYEFDDSWGTGYFYFCIDGTETLIEYSDTRWHSYSAIIPAGQHSIKFKNSRTESDYASNSIFIDLITINEASSFSFDNFDLNDGTVSTAHSWLRTGNDLPFITNSKSYSGSWSMQLGQNSSYNLLSNLICYSDTTEPSFLSLKLWTNYNSGDLQLLIDGTVHSNNFINNNWNVIVKTIPPGEHSIAFNNNRSNNYSSIYLDDIEVSNFTAPVNDSFETGDLSANHFISNTAYASVVDETGSDGLKALRLSAPGTSYDDWDFYLPVLFTTPVDISFNARTDYSNDYIHFYIDDVTKKTIGSTTWTASGPIHVEAGHYILRWQLDKSNSTADKYGWVDNITFQE